MRFRQSDSLCFSLTERLAGELIQIMRSVDDALAANPTLPHEGETGDSHSHRQKRQTGDRPVDHGFQHKNDLKLGWFGGYPGYLTFKKDPTLMLQWNIQIPDWETHVWLGVGVSWTFLFPGLHGKSGTLLQHAPSKNWSTWIWTWYEWSLLYDYGL